ncbi:hypothetical protein [Chryseobacterium sp. JAH]|uniref:hypothetical protein n=1 Tax=Chryseobacterium sp. JAH TaxID=1742858 RepID=UPI000740F28D|nr:hypothetical protein [Chryseobacterium sp. JAH]KUJ50052.1 hypothetical protein AR685_16840 [Chryseobacterium sp. JAH]
MQVQSAAENDFKTYLSKAGYKATEVDKEFPKGPAVLTGVYYLHGDLGTATYVTNEIAEPTQYFLNLPFGEMLVEQRDSLMFRLRVINIVVKQVNNEMRSTIIYSKPA